MNVSYDPTRELYREFNEQFVAKWLADTGQRVAVQMSHGGSGSQARAVIDGLNADVVTLALAWDIDNIQAVEPAPAGVVAIALAEQQLAVHVDDRVPRPQGQSEGHPRLARSCSARTSRSSRRTRRRRAARAGTTSPPGALRSNARSAAISTSSPSLPRGRSSPRRKPRPRNFVGEMYRRVPVQDTGARAATNTFVQRGIGDVLLAWENEALLAANEMGADAFDIVRPSVSVLAEPPVALIDSVVDRKGTRAVAEAYLDYLYAPEGQDIVARNFFRPSDPAVAERYAEQFPPMRLFTVDAVFGGWAQAQAEHFADGGIYDRLFLAAAARAAMTAAPPRHPGSRL